MEAFWKSWDIMESIMNLTTAWEQKRGLQK